MPIPVLVGLIVFATILSFFLALILDEVKSEPLQLFSLVLWIGCLASLTGLYTYVYMQYDPSGWLIVAIIATIVLNFLAFSTTAESTTTPADKNRAGSKDPSTR